MQNFGTGIVNDIFISYCILFNFAIFALDTNHQLFRVKRLFDVILCPQRKSSGDGVDIGQRGNIDSRGSIVGSFQLFEYVKTVLFGNIDIENIKIVAILESKVIDLLSVIRNIDLKSFTHKILLQTFAEYLIIFQ